MEKYFFIDSEIGIQQAFDLTLSLRRAGFKTRLRPQTIGTTPLYILEAVPTPRPNRRARGCGLRRENR